MPPLRIGLLGTGRAAAARARELARRSDAALVAVASASPERARAFASTWNAHACDSAEQLLARADVDAVMVSTVNQRHAALVEAALHAGKPVCVDYPLALSLPDGERLLSLARELNLVLHVEHIDLLSGWFVTLREHLDRIGHLLSVSWTDLSARQPKPGDWTFDLASGPTLFRHMAIASRLVAVAGPAASVACQERHVGLTAEGRFSSRTTMAQIHFASGVLGQVHDATGLAAQAADTRLLVVGTSGWLEADARQRVTLCTGGDPAALPPAPSTGLFAADIASFVAQVTQGTPSYYGPTHVLDTLRLAQLAHPLE